MGLTGQKVLIVGGSSGIGLATAQMAVQAGMNVTISGRSQQKLEQAKQTIGGNVETRQLDVSQEEAIQKFAASAGTFDHLVLPGSSIEAGAFKSLETSKARGSMESKFWGQYLLAKYIDVSSQGSIVFFSGIFGHRPPPNYAIVAAINAGIEGLGRALAVELAPIRVNVVSPGLIDTPLYRGMPEEQRKQYFQSVANSLPVKRVGRPEDIAQVVLFLMNNTFTTGTVIDTDGGGLLV